MQITIGGTTLCHGPARTLGNAMGPLGKLSITGQFTVQVARFLRAASAKPIQRGGRLTTIAFSVEREYANAAAVGTFLATHLAALPLDGTLVLTLDGGGTLSWTNAVLNNYDFHQIGVTLQLAYTYAAGALTT